jgi:hypothetical protein
VFRDRAARREQAQERARQALADADTLRRQGKWAEALGAARRAEQVLAGGAADSALREEVRALGRDLEMVGRLEEARLREAAIRDKGLDSEGAEEAYAGAFAWYGLDVDHLAVPAAAARIAGRPIRVQLAAALSRPPSGDVGDPHCGSRTRCQRRGTAAKADR